MLPDRLGSIALLLLSTSVWLKCLPKSIEERAKRCFWVCICLGFTHRAEPLSLWHTRELQALGMKRFLALHDKHPNTSLQNPLTFSHPNSPSSYSGRSSLHIRQI